jgi:starch phosphorylase
MAAQAVEWQQRVSRQWDSLRFGAFRVETTEDRHVFEIEVFLNGLDQGSVRIELYADGVSGGDPTPEEMTSAQSAPEASGRCVFQATVRASRPAGDYTARATPRRTGVSVPLEANQILWQR